MTLLPSTSLNRFLWLILADILSFLVVVAVGLGLAVFTRWVLFGTVQYPRPDEYANILIVFLPALVMLIWQSIALGHYSQFRPFWAELREVIKLVGIIAAFELFLLFIIGVQFSRLWFGFFLLGACVVVPYGREMAKMKMIRHGVWYQPTYIFGTGQSAARTAEAVASDSSLGYEITGFINLSGSSNVASPFGAIPVIDHIPDTVHRADGTAAKVIFAFDSLEELEKHQAVLSSQIAKSPFVTVVPPSMGLPLYNAAVVGIFRHDTVLLQVRNRLLSRVARMTKRSSDVVLGVLFLAIFSWIFLVLCFLIKRDGGPVFFKHTRVGRNGVEFGCYKFRSMVADGDSALKQHLAQNPAAQTEWENTRKLREDPRVTRIGKYLRKTSIDELPQLLNVLKGEMSLVGPRPVPPDEIALYGQFKDYYLGMVPGMTGLWQVSGRSDTTYDERVRLDVWYSRNWSLWTDLVVLIKTVKTLINRHGAY